MRRPCIENKKFWGLCETSLNYIANDARQALDAMPDGVNAGRYADEVNDVVTVLYHRRKNS